MAEEKIDYVSSEQYHEMLTLVIARRNLVSHLMAQLGKARTLQEKIAIKRQLVVVRNIDVS